MQVNFTNCRLLPARQRRESLRERSVMTNAEIKAGLIQVLQALNSIPVSGKISLANMVGSINVLEDIIRQLPEDEEEQ